MPTALTFRFNGQEVKAPIPVPVKVDSAIQLGAEKLDLPKDSFDLFDRYGKITNVEDLQRAIHMAGSGDCKIEVREHLHYRRLRVVENRHDVVDGRLAKLEEVMESTKTLVDSLVKDAMDEVMERIEEVAAKVDGQVTRSIEELTRAKNALQKDVRRMEEKVAQINLQELREISESNTALRNEVSDAVKKVNAIQESWPREKARLEDMCVQCQQDLYDLQKSLMGKLDVCIEADADLRREQQRVNERMALLADDLRLRKESHIALEKRCALALEESDELRTLLGGLREDSQHLRSDHAQVRTRVCVLEGSATERWQGFCPGVLYFKSWHRTAKGDDVQFSQDLQTATGRGFLSATGMVCGNTDGLAIADGPCRRFGTPGSYSSYYELEVEEIKQVPDGMGGLWVGFALQTCEEIAEHRAKEFDGWLIGGNAKAMVCRAGSGGAPEFDESKLPGTFAPGGNESVAIPNVTQAIELLRKALPPRSNGEMKEFTSCWNSQTLQEGDRLGVLWRSNRDVGARLRVSVNGVIVAQQEFVDAPTAEAVGFFTPIVRLAGSGKSVKLLPGLNPPSKMLAE